MTLSDIVFDSLTLSVTFYDSLMTAPSMDESLVVFSRIPQVRPPGGCRGEGRGVGGSPSPPGWGCLR